MFARRRFPSVLLGLWLLAVPVVASAQTPFSIESIGSQIGLGGADLKETVINIIQWVLGIVALVAVAVIILGIILVATSGDNADRADRAKRLIAGALIGLVIVLLAWAIVLFVARTTANVTQ